MRLEAKEKRRRQIRMAMVQRGIVGAEIARELGVTRQAVYRVIAGAKRSQRIIEALVRAGVPAGLFEK